MRFPVLCATAALICSTTFCGAVHAGPYADTLSKCLVKSTTAEDKNALVQWIFSVISLNPKVAWMVKIKAEERDDLSRRTGKLFETLVTETCLSETREAIRYEGLSAIEGAFSVLGTVAAREIFSDPTVASGMADIRKYVDDNRMKELLGTEK